MNMRSSMAVVVLAAALTGCATTSEETGAGGTAPVPPPANTGGRTETATGNGVSSAPVGRNPLATSTENSAAPALDLKRSVYYEFDKYDVKPEYRQLVERHARWLRANPGARLVIAGNTDEHGTSEYNLALGQRRAESVTRMLVLMGARAEQVEAVSFGKEKPRAAGHDEAAWAENRRSDFAQP